MASRADIHDLYEQSVQSVDTDVEFILTTFRALQGREPLSLREDFCGTGSACCAWVRTDRRRYAIGIDNDASVLAWGRKNRVARLKEADRPRVQLVENDVLEAETAPVDVVTAFNFSYYLLMERRQLVTYFSRVRNALNDDGLFFLDACGGPECMIVQKEKTKLKGFTYVWDQNRFDPMTHHMSCSIHFHFPDGSKLKKAFSYHWRLWTLPEVRDLLHEAGFTAVKFFWEGEDKHGDGNGVFSERTSGTPDPAWVAYIVARK